MPTSPNSFTAHAGPDCKQGAAPALLRTLASSATYRGHPQVVVHETHAAWVFVAGDRAYKIKKPVALGFLDYSTLARRHRACREEVRVNQALAPDLYLGVRAIVKANAEYRLADDGVPGAVEYAVVMRSFRAQDTLAGLIEANALTSAHVSATARLLADFHRSASVVGDWGPGRVLGVWRENVRELQALEHPAHWHLDGANEFARAFVFAHESELRERAQRGLARDGHGDLRCEHVLARPTVRVVDRIEFDRHLRQTDVACDLAFLTMDMEMLGQPWAARQLIAGYRRTGLDPGSEPLRCFYGAHWALVRAKVALIASAERGGDARPQQTVRAERLWSLSQQLCWRARAPLAVVVCGPAASGKSVLAAALSRCAQLPIVSSDAVRKRLAQLAPDEPAGAEHYSSAFTRATYEQLAQDARLACRRNDGVIVDATCRSRDHRAPLLAALGALGRPLQIVRCEAPLQLTLERAARRLQDPRRVSDATPQVAEEQFRAFEELDELPEGSVLRLDTAQALDDQVARVAHAVDLRALSPARTARRTAMRRTDP